MNNEQELIRRAQRGDGEAFRQLVEAYQTQVYRLALRMCGESAADDGEVGLEVRDGSLSGGFHARGCSCSSFISFSKVLSTIVSSLSTKVM